MDQRNPGELIAANDLVLAGMVRLLAQSLAAANPASREKLRSDLIAFRDELADPRYAYGVRLVNIVLDGLDKPRDPKRTLADVIKFPERS